MPNSSILNLFGQSPIKPLQAHMAKVSACVKHAEPFFEAVLAKNWKEAEHHKKLVVQLEHEADDMKRELRIHLPKGLFMPVSRTDLLVLLNSQDKLANIARDVTGMVWGRKMLIPAPLGLSYIAFLKRCIDAAKQVNHAIHELDEVLEAGFSSPEVKVVSNMLATLFHIEWETDEMQAELRQRLFECEQNMPPIDVIFLYKLLELTGDIADQSQDIGDRLQILLAR